MWYGRVGQGRVGKGREGHACYDRVGIACVWIQPYSSLAAGDRSLLRAVLSLALGPSFGVQLGHAPIALDSDAPAVGLHGSTPGPDAWSLYT